MHRMENEKELQEEKVLENANTLEEAPQAMADSPDLGEAIADGSEQGPLEGIDEPQKAADYSLFSKKDFVDLAHALSQDSNFKKVDSVLRDIKPLFDKIRAKEKGKPIERYRKSNAAMEGFE